MARDPQCIFCKIIAVEIPAAVVFEDEDTLAFLDIGPLADGHLLLIPRSHYSRLTEIPGAELAKITTMIPRLIKTVLSVTKAEGVNVLINDGTAAGQVVNHTHIHLIPRRSGDGLGYRWNAGKYAAGRDAELAAAYRGALAKH